MGVCMGVWLWPSDRLATYTGCPLPWGLDDIYLLNGSYWYFRYECTLIFPPVMKILFSSHVFLSLQSFPTVCKTGTDWALHHRQSEIHDVFSKDTLTYTCDWGCFHFLSPLRACSIGRQRPVQLHAYGKNNDGCFDLKVWISLTLMDTRPQEITMNYGCCIPICCQQSNTSSKQPLIQHL